MRWGCRCGEITGTYDPPRGAPRLVCHCDDCQAYARWLGTEVVDARGGTEVLQGWPSGLALTGGEGRVQLVRLSPQGLCRWYAACCRTPLGNTLARPGAPFVGVPRVALREPDDALAPYGPAVGIQGRFAVGGVPPGVAASAGVGVIVQAASLLGRGWLAGAHRPHPFFPDGKPRAEATVLTPAERSALTR